MLPSFRNGLIGRLLKTQNSPLQRIGFARCEELRKERLGAIIPGIHLASVSIEPLLRSPQKGERKQTEPDRILRYSLNNKITVELQELLEMSTGILIGLATEWAGLHHRDKTHLDLEIFSAGVNLGSGGNLVSRRSGVITECLLGHGLRS